MSDPDSDASPPRDDEPAPDGAGEMRSSRHEPGPDDPFAEDPEASLPAVEKDAGAHDPFAADSAGKAAPAVGEAAGTPTDDDAVPPPLALVLGRRTLTVVLLFVGLELLLSQAGRHGWWGLTGIGQWVVTEQSERYGWVMLPDQDRLSREMTVPEIINGHRFRDRDWADPVPDGNGGWVKDDSLFRVAILGNSMTYGTSVAIEDTYGRLLEARLQEHLDAAGDPRTALVMNCAVQGYVFEQMARTYEDIVSRWQPDVLVVPFHPHDIMPMKPSQDDPDYDLRTTVLRTATFDWLNRVVINKWMPRVPGDRDRSAMREWAELDLFITEQPFHRDNKPYREAAMARMDTLLDQLEERDARLAILSLPRWRKHFQPNIRNAEAIWNGYAFQRRDRALLHVNPWSAFEPPMAALVDEIRAKGFEAWTTHDLNERSWTDADGVEHPGTDLEHGADSLYLLYDTGHYTEAGHAVLAEQLYAGLAAADGWLP